MKNARLEHLERLYALTDLLAQQCGGWRRLAACSGRDAWPRRGVYFFAEDGEERSDTGAGPRIVRVGTHALKSGSKTSLWQRLSQHRGTSRSGGGNHRGSIFRLIIGTALIARDGHECPSWDNGRASAPSELRAAEGDLERAVSRTIGAMRFIFLPALDEPGRDSARGEIERNAIALLSNYGKPPLDPPSPGWLGHHCNRPLIRMSGLWNARHVDEAYDPAFLDRFAALIEIAQVRA